jgi:hypothetical protein
MCFKGTREHSKARNLLMEYNKIGAYFNAYTEKRYTTYTLTCDDNHIEHCTNLLSEMLMNSSFSKKEFYKEQHVVVEENIRTQDNNSYMLEKALDKLYFKGSSYENPIDIIDYHPTATYLKYEDVYQWYKWFYRPSNMVCSVVSNISFAKIVTFLKKSYFMNTVLSQLNTDGAKLRSLINKKIFNGTLSKAEEENFIFENDKKNITGLILKTPYLKKFSTKFFTILERLNKLVEGKKGASTAFIYSNLVKAGGMELFAETLLQNGYLEYQDESTNYDIKDETIDYKTGLTYLEFNHINLLTMGILKTFTI